MSSETALNDLVKLAVVGLQNSSDYDDILSHDIKQLINTKSYNNDSQRFLDAATLTALQAELSRVPDTDTFDELPEIPEENLKQLNPAQRLQLERLFHHQHRSPGRAALMLLQRFGYALPDTLFCDLMKSEKLDRASRKTLASVAGAKARWLTDMNSQWRAILGDAFNENAFSKRSLSEQTRHLANTPPLEITEFCLQEWDNCNAEGRRLLLAFLRSHNSTPSTELTQWLSEKLNDKSNQIKRDLLRWFITTDHPQAEPYRQAAADLLSKYLDANKPRKPDLTVPEELSEEWSTLAIVDQDYLSTNQPKPVQRLAQLLVLTGPQNWAQQLNCKSSDAMDRLLKSRFGEELEPYLLEAALYHQDDDALKIWIKKVKIKEHSRLPDQLAQILAQLGPILSIRIVEFILQQKNIVLLLSTKLWQQLIDFRQALSNATNNTSALTAFEYWCQHCIKHRYYFDTDIASLLPLWLDIPADSITNNKHWKALRAKEKYSSADLDLCEALFQLKTELQLHSEVMP